MLYWCRLYKFLIDIYHGYVLLEMDFSFHLELQALPSMWYCNENSILTKQIHDIIHLLCKMEFMQVNNNDNIDFIHWWMLWKECNWILQGHPHLRTMSLIQDWMVRNYRYIVLHCYYCSGVGYKLYYSNACCLVELVTNTVF